LTYCIYINYLFYYNYIYHIATTYRKPKTNMADVDERLGAISLAMASMKVSESLRFDLSDEGSSQALGTNYIRVNADRLNYGVGDTITLDIPYIDGAIDLAESFIEFQVLYTDTTGAGAVAGLIDNSVHSLFETVRLRSASGVIEEVHFRYPQYASAMSDLTLPALRGSGPAIMGGHYGLTFASNAIGNLVIGGTGEGTAGPLTRSFSTLTHNTPRTFFIQPYLSFWKNARMVLPTGMLQSAQLQLEMIVSPINKFLNSVTTNSAFSVQRVRGHYKLVKIADPVMLALKEIQMIKASLSYPFTRVNSYTYNVASGSSSMTVNLPNINKRSIRDLLFIWRPQSTPASDTSYTNRPGTVANTTISRYYLTLGSETFPRTQPVEAGQPAEVLSHLARIVDSSAFYDSAAANLWYSAVAKSGARVYGLDLITLRGLYDSGVDASSPINQAQLNVELAGSTNAVSELEIFIHYDSALLIKQDGVEIDE
jgi:hypothetical protein